MGRTPIAVLVFGLCLSGSGWPDVWSEYGHVTGIMQFDNGNIHFWTDFPRVDISGCGGDRYVIASGNTTNSTTVTTSLPVPTGSQPVAKLWMKVHNLQYDRLASVKINSGNWIDLTNGTPNLTVNINNSASLIFATSQHIASLNVASGANAAFTTGVGKTLFAGAVTIAAGGKLDLGGSEMVIDVTPGNAISLLAAMNSLVEAARNSGALVK